MRSPRQTALYGTPKVQKSGNKGYSKLEQDLNNPNLQAKIIKILQLRNYFITDTLKF